MILKNKIQQIDIEDKYYLNSGENFIIVKTFSVYFIGLSQKKLVNMFNKNFKSINCFELYHIKG